MRLLGGSAAFSKVRLAFCLLESQHVSRDRLAPLLRGTAICRRAALPITVTPRSSFVRRIVHSSGIQGFSDGLNDRHCPGTNALYSLSPLSSLYASQRCGNKDLQRVLVPMAPLLLVANRRETYREFCRTEVPRRGTIRICEYLQAEVCLSLICCLSAASSGTERGLTCQAKFRVNHSKLDVSKRLHEGHLTLGGLGAG
jgi:hypothetical protein